MTKSDFSSPQQATNVQGNRIEEGREEHLWSLTQCTMSRRTVACRPLKFDVQIPRYDKRPSLLHGRICFKAAETVPSLF
jgi:hypothetical protein